MNFSGIRAFSGMAALALLLSGTTALAASHAESPASGMTAAENGRVVYFEFAVDNPTEAAKFYEGLFGWKFSKWDGEDDYWQIQTGAAGSYGVDGGMMPREVPEQGSNIVINVVDLDATVAAITKAGGQILVPRMSIPGVGYMAYFQAPDKNVFGLMQFDPMAKADPAMAADEDGDEEGDDDGDEEGDEE